MKDARGAVIAAAGLCRRLGKGALDRAPIRIAPKRIARVAQEFVVAPLEKGPVRYSTRAALSRR